MHLELARDKSEQFPAVADPLAVASARIWHCGYKSLAVLSQFRNLTALSLAAYPDDTFETLSTLTSLHYLSVLHFPRVSGLAPLGRLGALETLSLASLPSWDASGKVLTVDSLEPIAELKNLRHLELFGVRPSRGGLSPLLACKNLRSARFSKFTKTEVATFYQTSGVKDEFAPRPGFAAA
jgi:hypothetical protein